VSFIVLDTDVASTILRGRLADPLRSDFAEHDGRTLIGTKD
jgi:hypothetical protein